MGVVNIVSPCQTIYTISGLSAIKKRGRTWTCILPSLVKFQTPLMIPQIDLL